MNAGNRTKVLTAYYRPKPGGFCKRLYMMMEAYTEGGYEVHYLSLEKLPLRGEMIVHHPLRTPVSNERSVLFWPFFFMAASLAMLRVCRREGIGLISVFGTAYACMALPAKILRRIPLVAFVRSDAAGLDRVLGRPAAVRGIQHLAAFAALRLSTLVVPVSETLKRGLGRYGRREMEVLPNNIVVSGEPDEASRAAKKRELGLGEGTFAVATSGMINRGKNVEFLIREFARIGRGEARLLVIGDGPSVPGLRELARSEGVAGRVLFTGWREDAAEIVGASDLFVFPSVHEGSSNALLEAVGLGVPVLAGRIEENREMLVHDELLFGFDAPGGLAARMERAMADEGYRAGLKALTAGRREALSFDWKERVRRIARRALAGAASGG